MKKYKSSKPNTLHFFLSSPFTIDKSAEWGEGNVQQFPNGGWLQIDSTSKDCTHGVQSENENNLNPLGWTHVEGNLYKKNDIYAEQTESTFVTLHTKDGVMQYDNPDKNGWICYNVLNNKPDLSDPWFVTNNKFLKLYIEL